MISTSFKPTLRESVTFALRIPSSIDIDSILFHNPPKFNCINKDNLLYLIDLIYKKGNYYSYDYFKHKRDGFIPLKAEYLRNILPAYHLILDYLIANGIIETDNHYIPAIVSKGYRIPAEFLTGEDRTEYFESSKLYFKLYEQIELDKRESERWARKRGYLYQPFRNGSITIDYDSALKCLDEICQEKEIIASQEMKIESDDYYKKIRSVKHFHENQKRKMMRIIKSDYEDYLITDRTSHRFHTPITSLKRELRKYIKIEGEEIAELDIRNSQPFFFLMFFKREFWDNRNKNNIIRLIDMDYEYWEYLRHTLNNRIPYMIPKYGKSLVATNDSVSHFCKLIREGMLYDYFVDNYGVNKPEIYGVDKKRIREAIKKELLAYIYDTNREGYLFGLRRFFSKEFPVINSALYELKSFETGYKRKLKKVRKKNGKDDFIEVDEGFTKLVITLQKIESLIFLDRVCKRISEEYPDLNYVTIHDAIYLPKSKVDLVKPIMLEEISKATGEMPLLG